MLLRADTPEVQVRFLGLYRLLALYSVRGCQDIQSSFDTGAATTTLAAARLARGHSIFFADWELSYFCGRQLDDAAREEQT
jgi:hypothetical protein